MKTPGKMVGAHVGSRSEYFPNLSQEAWAFSKLTRGQILCSLVSLHREEREFEIHIHTRSKARLIVLMALYRN